MRNVIKNKKMKSGIGSIKLILFGTVALLLLLYIIINCYFCSDSILENKMSPDGKYKIIAYVNSCGGASSSTYTAVCVLKGWIPFIIGITDFDRGNYFFTSPRNCSVTANWKDNKTIEVIYDEKEEYVYKKEQVLKDINVIFEREKNNTN